MSSWLCIAYSQYRRGLSLSLSKIGALAFGGGFPAIPLIQYETVDQFHWLSTTEFLDGIALGQVTLGPILIKATFIEAIQFNAIGVKENLEILSYNNFMKFCMHSTG